MRKGSKLSLRKQAAAGKQAPVEAVASPLPLGTKLPRRSHPAPPPRSPLNPMNAAAAGQSPETRKAEAPVMLLDHDDGGSVETGGQAGMLMEPVVPDAQLGMVSPAQDAGNDENDNGDDEEVYADEDDSDSDSDHEDDDDDDFDAPMEQQGGVKGLAERLANRSGASARPTRSSARSRRSSGVDLDAPVSADVPEADLLRRQRNIAMMEANACASHSAAARDYCTYEPHEQAHIAQITALTPVSLCAATSRLRAHQPWTCCPSRSACDRSNVRAAPSERLYPINYCARKPWESAAVAPATSQAGSSR